MKLQGENNNSSFREMIAQFAIIKRLSMLLQFYDIYLNIVTY